MLERLKEYKELIAILAFFLGGFIWLQSQFPSKADLRGEIGAIRCQLDQYMKLTQLQILSQDLSKHSGLLKNQLASAEPLAAGGSMTALSPAMRLEIEQMRAEYSDCISQLGKATMEMKKINEDLARGVCGKVTP